MTTGVNWQEGWRRVRVALWIMWVVAVAIYLPYDAARSWDSWRDIVTENYAAHPTPELSKRADEAWMQSTFAVQLHRSLHDRTYWLAVGLFGIVLPLIAYGAWLLIARIGRWIISGFVRQPR